jgi:hypothetical protein
MVISEKNINYVIYASSRFFSGFEKLVMFLFCSEKTAASIESYKTGTSTKSTGGYQKT